MKIHEKYMARCLHLAANGLGQTYPNPMVGSVIVYQDRIIGEGWHKRAGEPHAEVMAVNSVKDRSLLAKATLYVNLEPCNHHGRTPPCSELIINCGIKEVVIGNLDPNPQVSGTGIKRLEASGISVTQGVLEDECTELNKRFLTYHQHKRPYVILKWAQSEDGYISPREQTTGQPYWISNKFSRQQAHRLRANEQAILIGSETLRKDDPSLSTRYWWGNSPLALIWTSNGSLPENRKLWQSPAEKLILQAKQTHNDQQDSAVAVAHQIKEPGDILNLLYDRGIQSLIVEGGASVAQQFLDSGLWDETIVFQGKQSLGSGLRAPEVIGREEQRFDILEDKCILYKPSL